MKSVLFSTLICLISSMSLSLAGPEEALNNYFKAIKTRDANLLKQSVHAPEDYKKSFAKMLDVVTCFIILEDLIADKYQIPHKDRVRMSAHASGLNKKLIKRKFKIEGDSAQSIPEDKGEVPAHFIRVDGKWLLDMQRGQPEESMKQQAKLLDESYTAVIALLKGLILNIDTINTKKFTYKQALDIVGIKVNRKLDEVLKNSREKKDKK